MNKAVVASPNLNKVIIYTNLNIKPNVSPVDLVKTKKSNRVKINELMKRHNVEIIYLEKLTSVSVEANVIKGIGVASKAVGKFIGSIPVVKEGQVDEFLQESGAQLKEKPRVTLKTVWAKFAHTENARCKFATTLNVIKKETSYPLEP